MIRRNLLYYAAGLLAATQLIACGTGESGTRSDEAEGSVPTVYTVNYPLFYFAQRIGGDIVRVEFPGPAAVDPAFWMPDAQDISGYQSADLILLNGATYAKWIDKVSLPESRMVFTSDGFDGELIPVEGAVTHTHGPGGEHSHEGTAFTTWLDPALAIQHAEAIKQSFVIEWPEYATEFQSGLDSLTADLTRLDEALEAAAGEWAGQPLVASHPVYQYLARAYQLDIKSVQWEPGEAPSASMWNELRALLRDHPARVMLWEDVPLRETARQLGELGVESVVFNPCGNRPAEGDYLSVMRENAAALRSGSG